MNHRACRRFASKVSVGIGACSAIVAAPHVVRADPISVVTTAISVVQKLYSAYEWEACSVGKVCPESETLVDATNVINAIESTIYSVEAANLKACGDSLVSEAQDDYGDLAKLALPQNAGEESLLRDNAMACFNVFYEQILAARPADQNASEFTYNIAPAFDVMAALVDNILRTAQLRGIVNVGTDIDDFRTKTQQINYSLIGSNSVWYQCPGILAPVMVRTGSIYDHYDEFSPNGVGPFSPKKLWLHFANYGFSYDECENNCNLSTLVTSPSSPPCYTTWPAYCFGGEFCGCGGDEWSGDPDAPGQSAYGPNLAFDQELPKIMAKMDQDAAVATIRASMNALAGLGKTSVDEPYCGASTGQLGSGLQVASSVIAKNAAGGYEVVDTRADGALYHNRQVPPGGGAAPDSWGWSGESALGGAAKHTAITSTPQGNLMLFYIGLDGALYRQGQYPPNFPGDRPNGAWDPPIPFGWSAEQLAVSHDADGRIDLFYIGLGTNLYNETSFGLYHTWQTPNPACELCDNTWSGQLPIQIPYGASGLPSTDAKRIAVATNQDGRLEIFYIARHPYYADDNALYHVYQTTPQRGPTADNWSAPLPLGGTARELAVNVNGDGRIELFYIGIDNAIYHNYQVAPNSGAWSGEQPMGGAGKQIAVGHDWASTLDLFVVGTNDRLYQNWQSGSGWTGYYDFGAAGRNIAVGDRGDLRTIFVGMNGALYQNWKEPWGWVGAHTLYSAPPATTVNSAPALYRDTSTMLNGSQDWMPNYGKANCANGWRITGLAARNSIDEMALCVGPNPALFSGQIDANLVYDPTQNQRRATRSVGTSTDWDYGYIKLECGYGEYVAGIAEGASFLEGNNNFRGVQCGSAGSVAGASSSNVCTTQILGGVNGFQDARATTVEGDWDYGAVKAECDVDQYLAGVSVNMGSGQVHALLCCNNNP